MARMRFPGRPGCRTDRVGIPYSAEDVVDSADPTLQFIASLHSGLREFRELCGESEDEEFCGFSEEDVRQSGKKLRAAVRSEQKLHGIRPGPSGVVKEEHHHPHTLDHKSEAEHKSHSLEGIFGSPKSQVRNRPLSRDEIMQKALAAKELLASLKAKHKHALQGRVVQNKVGRPRKHPVQPSEPPKKSVEKVQKAPQVAPPVAPVEEKKITTGKRVSREQPLVKLATKHAPFLQTEKKSTKTRLADKMNLKWQGVKKKKVESKPESQPGKLAKERPKSVVKQLLQRAKQGGSRPLPKAKDVGQTQSQATDQPTPQRRTTHTFVLPKFSRSRRAIIPNKRFIEDDPIPSALLIKRPRTESTPLMSPPTASTEVKIEKESTPATPVPSKKAEKTKAPPTATPSSRRTPKQPSSTATTPQGVGKRTPKASSKPELTAATPKSSQVETPQNVTGATLSTDQLHQLEMSPVVAVTPHKLDLAEAASGSGSSDLLVTAETSLSTFRKGLLEQPLIREGKRQRVPSLKVRMIKRQSEESTLPGTEGEDGESSALKGEEGKQNGSKKEKFHLFPKALPSAPKTFNRAGPMKLQRRDKDGKESILTKRSGQIMLRKAKLQLNRTALNRSKAALARSLKAQLKREAKQKGRKSQPQRHSPRPGVTSPLSISVLGSGGSHPFDSPNSQPSQPSPLLASQSPGSQVGFASPPKIISSLSPISLPSKKEPGEATADKPKDTQTSERKNESGGPRIKHVCRRAAVVLPKPLATFPAPPEASMSPTLSALPSPEKEKLLQSHSASRAQRQDSSDEERATSSKRSNIVRPAGMKLGKKRRPVFDPKLGRLRKRKGRCQECSGCRAPNCGKCVYCLDSKKFGGKNILKKACVNRTCKRPIYTKRATEAFIQPKTKGGEGDEVDSSQVRQGPSRMARPSVGYFASLGEPTHGESVQDEGEEQRAGQKAESPEAPPQERPRQRAGRVPPQDEEADGGGVNEGGLEIMSAVRMPRHVLTNHARRLLKRKEKAGVRVRLPTVVPQPQPFAALTRFWSVLPNTRSIVHTQLKENFDLDFAWGRGLALTMAGPTCMRAVCFLCGSAGREKLLYCSICCEPFHWFCLDEEDRPLEGVGMENWCCRRCQFCHVCGLQTGLLQCDRCQDTYHPECLGPAYPKQPSRRNVWVCTKCVKCKSCGATTPGSGHNATWTYDFSLCFECGKLMDKGNFCPVCRKCYADDDWESKMVQCSLCESWVHARCEGLNDEMYQLFSYLPEDIQYRCRVCSPVDPPEWQTILQDELLNGLKSVLTGLTSFKCSSHLLVVDAAKEKERVQRAQNRKRSQVAAISSEAVRSSPRAQKQSLSNTQDSSALTGTDIQTSAQKSVDNPDDHKVDVASLTPEAKKYEDSMISVNESAKPSPPKHLCSSDKPSVRESDLGSSSSCGSQVKAAKMSEVGIFERFAQTYEKAPENTDAVEGTRVVEVRQETECSEEEQERLCLKEQPGARGCSEQKSGGKCYSEEKSGATGCSEDKTGSIGCSEQKEGTECSEEKQGIECCSEEKPETVGCSKEKHERLCSSEGQETRCSVEEKEALDCHTASKTECSSKGETENTRQKCSVSQPEDISKGDFSLMHIDPTLPSSAALGRVSKSQAATSLTQDTSPSHTAPYLQTAASGLHTQLSTTSQTASTQSLVATSLLHQAVTSPMDTTPLETNVPCLPPQTTVTTSQASATTSETITMTSSPTTSQADSVPSQTSVTNSLPQAATSSRLIRTTSQTTAATSTTTTGSPDDNQSTRCPVSSTIRTPASISRNLFETFFAVSKNDSNSSGQPVTESSGELSDTHRGGGSDIRGGVRKQDPDSSSPSDCAKGRDNHAEPQSLRDISQHCVTGSGATSTPIPDGLTVKTDQDASPQNSCSTLSTSGAQRSSVMTSARSTPGSAGRHVSMAEGGQTKALVPRSERQFPPDFNTVRMKLEGGRYSSVEEFNEDMVHIIQSALSDDERFPTRKKHSNSVKSIFMKQMERVFPWFNVKTCHLWQHNRILPQGMLPDAVVPPHQDHTYAQWLEREIIMTSTKLSPFKCLLASPDGSTNNAEIRYTSEDLRQCVLCLEFGDDFPGEAGRLLYAGQDDWVHVNCALWSAEVFEESDHTLQNVHVAMVRGRQMRCDRCRNQGATVGCCIRGCPANYHFLCARREHCVFKEDKTVYCFLHRDQSNTLIEEQRDFSVGRRLCVDMADIRCMKKSWARGLDAAFVNILFGSCTVENLGSLAPLSDCRGCLLPLDFRCSRVYWSTVDARQRTVYTCRIIEVRPTPTTPELTRRDIRVIHDENHPDFVPLSSLDLPSMGLSHLLPISNDAVVSQASREKTSLLFEALTNSSQPDSLRQPSLMETDLSAGGVRTTSLDHSKCHMQQDGSELARSESSPISGMEDTAEISQAAAVERTSACRLSAFSVAKTTADLQSNPTIHPEKKPLGKVAPSAAAFDYSKLSPSTLKMLNISDPQNIRPAPSIKSSIPASSPSGRGDFGNLAGMIERLNRAAMRSRSNSSGGHLRKPGQPMRNERCRSVDRTATPCVSPASILRKRSVSLSPVGFTARPASPFLPPQPRITSPPLCFSRSRSPSPTVTHVRKSPSVTPILEQLETELTEQDSQGKRSAGSAVSASQKWCHRPSVPVSGEAFVDLTKDDEAGPVVGGVQKNDKMEDTDDSRKGNSEENTYDGDMVLAQHILETVPKEILEGSEVKVLVIPENVSEEEALQLAQEALLETGDAESQQTPQAVEVTPEGNNGKNLDLPPTVKGVPESSVVVDPADKKDVWEKGKCENVLEDDCVIVASEMLGPTSKKSSIAERLVSCSREIKQELLAEDNSNKIPSNDAAVTHNQSQSAIHTTPSASQATSISPSPSEPAVSKAQSDSSTSVSSKNSASSTSCLQDVVSASQSQNCCTSTLKMAQRLETMPVYDKSGNLIGQRVCRPYVVETVKKTASAIHIRRHHSRPASRSKGLEERIMLPLKGLSQDGVDKVAVSMLEKPAEYTEASRSKETATSAESKESEVPVQDTSSKDVSFLTTTSAATTSLDLQEIVRAEGVRQLQKTERLAASEETGESDKAEVGSVASVCTDGARVTESVPGHKEAADQTGWTKEDSSQNHGEISQHGSSSLILPRDLDVSKLQCSVNVCKLSLDSPRSSSISIKDLCEQCSPQNCTATTLQGRNTLKHSCCEPSSVMLSTRKGTNNAECADSLVPSSELDIGKESHLDGSVPKIPEGVKGKAEENVASSASVGLLDLKHDLMKGSTPSILSDIDEIGLGPVISHDLECDKLMGPVGKKPVCNGCGAPFNKDRLLEKHPMVELALNPPPSVANNKMIAESLRTVECCVSLERLSSSGGSQYNRADNDVERVGGTRHNAQDASPCPPLSQPPAAAPVQQPVLSGDPASSHQPLLALGHISSHQPLSASGLISHAQNGTGGAIPAPTSVARTKPAPSSSQPFNRNFMDFLKTGTSQSCSPVPEKGLLQNNENNDKNVMTGNSCSANSGTTFSDSHSSQSQAAVLQSLETGQQSAVPSESGDVTSETRTSKEETKGEGEAESLPLHTEIALRIKAESLARSSPGESGPFKCPTCKRLYRTADSFHAHAQSCDFDLSTSDEDDEGEEESGGDNAEKESEDVKDGDDMEDASQKGMRTSLRQSTLTQRKAMESSQQQLAQQAAEKVVAFRSPPVTRKPQSGTSSDETQHLDSRGRGRPKKMTQLASENAHVLPPATSQNAAAEPVKRGRGRPRKVTTLDPADQEPVPPSQQLSPKQSMLGAVGLVSKDCLGVQVAEPASSADEGLTMSPAEPSQKSSESSQKSPAVSELSQKSPSAPEQLRTRSRRLSSHSPSSVVRRCQLRKISQESTDAGNNAEGEVTQLDETESHGKVDSLLMIAENKVDLGSPEVTSDKPVSMCDPGKHAVTETSAEKCEQMEENLHKDKVSGSEVSAIGQDPVNFSSGNTETTPVDSCKSSPGDQAAKDSDNDSDVVCLDDDPLPPSVRPPIPKVDRGPRQLLRKVLDEGLVHPYGLKFLPGAGDAPKVSHDTSSKNRTKNSSVAEKHRSTSPILSRLASSLPSSLVGAPLQVNVTGLKDKRVEITVKPNVPTCQTTQVHQPQSLQSHTNQPVLSHPSQTVQFHPHPITQVQPTSASSGAVNLRPSFSSNDFPSESDKSQSSLLLSSSNVQADIDSDDLSFTDSEDEEMSMDTIPVAPTAPVSIPHINVRLNINTFPPEAPKVECPKTPEQQQANQLLSVLDKLSPDQKVVLTQQLLKTGALNIEDHSAAARSQAGGMPQNQGFQPSASVMVHVSQTPQPLLPTSSHLRIINTGPGIGGGQLAFFSQPEVRQTSGLQPMLVSQQPQPAGAAVMVQAQPSVVMRQPGISVRQVPPLPPSMAPITSLPQPQPAFTPSAAGLTALGACPATSLGVPTSASLGVHSSLGTHGTSPLGGHVSSSLTADGSSPSLGGHPSTSLGAGLLSPQVQPAVFCPQPPTPLLNAYQPQPLGAPPAQRLGYMGSFLVDPASNNTGALDHNKAKLQLLSILQGAISSSAANATPSPVQGAMSGLLTTVAGGSGGAVAPVPSHQPQPPRVIRVVLDKSFSSDAANIAPRIAAAGGSSATGSSGQPYIRVVKVPSSGLPPALAPAMPSFPSMLPPASANAPGVLAGAAAISPASQILGGGLAPDKSKATFIVRKRPLSATLPSQGPPSKRVVSLAADSNGMVQGRLGDPYPVPSSSIMQGSPAALAASSTLSPSGMLTQSSQVNMSSTNTSSTGMANKFGNVAHMSHNNTNSTLAEIRSLKVPGYRARKQNISIVRKDTSGSSSSSVATARLPGKGQGKGKGDKVKVKASMKKKAGRMPKGGSHPIVHLSHQAGAILPQAEVEEEIRDTPLRNTQSMLPSQQPDASTKSWPKDMARLAYEISSQDGFSCQADTMEEAWRQVTEKVQDARAAARMKQLSYAGLNGVQMFGVGHDSVVYLVEQLAGAQHCRDYRFRYQDYEPMEDEELSINPSGCARCTPFTTRNPVDVFSFLMSRHRHRPRKVAANSKEEEMEHKSSRRATSMELPMAMRFRKLQEHAKEAVGVYRSRIHGRGLFCKRNIDNGEMVIEYAGEIIRSLLTDKREKYYESKGIGCYMFRIDDCEVVDATMHGSAARFINHSCEPNCYSKVINVDGKKHIVIFASRAIKMGEELTYDYKFPIEDVKIPCSCGSRKCRKYLN